MPSFAAIVGFTVVNLAVLYQLFLKDVLFVAYGVQRELQPLSDFPYTCRRLTDHNIAACEDAWIDHSSRQLFLACSNALARKAWNPHLGQLAADRRSRFDHIVALSLDVPHPQDPTAFDYRVLDLGDYANALGDKEIDLVGMTGRTLPDGTINLYFVNDAPSFDLTTQSPHDQALTGANSTIEAFSLQPHSSTLKHLHTFYNPTHITTPNNVAVLSDGSIIITNDHGPHRVGIWHTLSPIVGSGTVAHCHPPSNPSDHATCTQITSDRHKFPNGLHFSTHDNLLYVPSSGTGKISVYHLPQYDPSTPLEQQQLDDQNSTTATTAASKLSTIPIGMPLDNISEDPSGTLLVAGFPKLRDFEELVKQSTPIDGRGAPTTIWKITRKGTLGEEYGEKNREWTVEKLLEDPEGTVLPAATTAVRDHKTGRVFVVGIVSPWIAVCEPR